MRIPENNWNNVLLLDLQKRLFKMLKKFVIRFINHLNGLQTKTFIEKKKKIVYWFVQSGINGIHYSG